MRVFYVTDISSCIFRGHYVSGLIKRICNVRSSLGKWPISKNQTENTLVGISFRLEITESVVFQGSIPLENDLSINLYLPIHLNPPEGSMRQVPRNQVLENSLFLIIVQC